MAIPSLTQFSQEPGGGINAVRRGNNQLVKEQLETKFKPLEMAVKAQNSLAYNSKSGNIGMYLRSIQMLPDKQRQAYLSDPNNYAYFMNMTHQFQNASQQEQGGRGNALTSMIQNFDFGGQQQNPLANIMSLFTGGQGAQQQEPKEVPQPQQTPDMQMQPPMQQPQQQPSVMTQDAVMQPSQQPTDQRSDRELNYYQHLANQAGLTSTQKNRFESAGIFEDWLNSNREEYSTKIANAAKYAGALGRGQKYVDMLKKEQPQAYNDYVWYHDTFAPSLVNQVKMMEHMASSNSQREELHGMIPGVDNLASNPKGTIKQINQAIKTMGQISDSVFKMSEPLHPGAYKKLKGWKDYEGDYIQNIPEEYNQGKKQSRTQEAGNSKTTKYATNRLAKGIVMPKFDTKKEGVAWFKRQSPQVQAAIREHLRK